MPWSQAEELELVRVVEVLGGHKKGQSRFWKRCVELAQFAQLRTPQDCKDKLRNIRKNLQKGVGLLQSLGRGDGEPQLHCDKQLQDDPLLVLCDTMAGE
jgi:hypothetical protein